MALRMNGTVSSDLHLGNVGTALSTLNDHPPGEILHHFAGLECTVVLPTVHPQHPQALPPYLVPSISVSEYLAKKDSVFRETPLRAEIIDLGNGHRRIHVDEPR